MKRTILAIAVLALFTASPAFATFGFVQEKHQTTACSSNSCTIPAVSSAFIVGHVVFVFERVNAVSITSTVTDNASPSSNTYNQLSGTTQCNSSNTNCTTIFWAHITNGSATQISYTETGSPSSAAGLLEFSFTGSSVAIDTGNSTGTGAVDNTATNTSHTGAALTINGGNDLALQFIGCANTISSTVTGGPTYTVTVPAALTIAYGYALNTINGGAVTWSSTGASKASMSSVALSETGAPFFAPRVHVVY